MLDYKLLSALAAVVEQGGFERAAQALGLSQSAISQRIKLLEARTGRPVLLRQTPPAPTELGQRLLNHMQQVRLLEYDLRRQVPALDDGGRQRLRISLNADSLATWWADAVGAFCNERQLLLDLQVEDQDVGLRRMRVGEVAACVCAAEQPLAGARSEALGHMRYLAVASPEFLARYLPADSAPRRLMQVPGIVFGSDDRLQHRFFERLGLEGAFEHHLCPSSEGFVRLLEAGLGWGMVPRLQIREALASGRLCRLPWGEPLDVPLYWHHWRNGGDLLAALGDQLRRRAPALLAEPDTQ